MQIARSAAASEPHRAPGRKGLAVFPVGLGGMALSMALSMAGAMVRATADATAASPQSPDAPSAVIRAALEAGIAFIDSANVYCPGTAIGANERLIGDTLRTLGVVDVVIATKGGVDRVRGRIDASPAFLRALCIASLRALGREATTLYQLHAPDDAVPLEDSIGERARLQSEGKILHLGLCNATADEVARAQRTARIETVQNACHPLCAEDYRDGLVAACAAEGVSYIPHTMIGGAGLHAQIAALPVIAEMALRYGLSAPMIVVAWHLAKGPNVIPIPGATRIESVASSALAAGLVLARDDVAAIDGLYVAA